MQKFTIVIGILTVCVIYIVAEILLQSSAEPVFTDMKADVLNISGKEYKIEDLLASSGTSSGTAQIQFDFSLVSEDDLRQAGLYDYATRSSLFSGYLFGFIDLSSFSDIEITSFELIDNGLNIPVIAGEIHELRFDDESLSNEMYKLMLEKAGNISGFTINETNGFGDASFFINDDIRIGTAFLLVKSGKKVYAFTYPKVKHENIKKLIEKLHGKEN